jgi:uracil-DNA glycosylase
MVEESLRRQYLEAMGIQNWLGRAAAPGPAAVPEHKPVALDPAPRVEELSLTPDSDIASLGWDALRSRVKACQACDLHQTRTQTVFGIGNQDADLLIIGEAPGADEDRVGEPFVGKAGQLLNAMLKAIGFNRDQVFIANILKCRPPGNRDPHSEEALRCEPFLQRQIELIQPKVILAVGRVAAQHLLKTDMAVGKLRGRKDTIGEAAIPVIVTYHPAYLLRSPEQKGKAWQDLQRVKRML